MLRHSIALAFALTFAPQAEAQTLRIYHIDVDQGDATLFVSPGGRTLLVDSGKNGHGSRLRAVLAHAGVTQIDHFVATHYHEDHYGGIDDLTESPAIPIMNVYDRGDTLSVSAHKRGRPTYRGYRDSVGHNAEHLTRGETIPLDSEMSVVCISSGGVVLNESDPTAHGQDENDMSISLLIQLGSFRYFVGGDIETATETKIAELDVVTDVDVYQTNHHGAENGSSQAFLDDLQPTVIVISNGNRADYRHPRQSTLNRMHNLTPRPAVYQTNKYLHTGDDGGNVQDQFIADLEAADTDGTILITVDGGAGSYTVSYRNQQDTFNIKRGQPARVVIESLLPMAPGPDRLNEEVTLRNDGSTPVSMSGWFLRDASGRVWALVSVGTVAAGQSATIQRNGMPMSLNDRGDTIELIDTANEVRDRFTYSSSAQGAPIQTGH